MDACTRRILTNVFLSGLPKRRREQATAAIPDDAAPQGPDSEQRIDMATALRDLSPTQRAMVVLRFMEDLSVAEVTTKGEPPMLMTFDEVFTAARRHCVRRTGPHGETVLVLAPVAAPPLIGKTMKVIAFTGTWRVSVTTLEDDSQRLISAEQMVRLATTPEPLP